MLTGGWRHREQGVKSTTLTSNIQCPSVLLPQRSFAVSVMIVSVWRIIKLRMHRHNQKKASPPFAQLQCWQVPQHRNAVGWKGTTLTHQRLSEKFRDFQADTGCSAFSLGVYRLLHMCSPRLGQLKNKKILYGHRPLLLKYDLHFHIHPVLLIAQGIWLSCGYVLYSMCTAHWHNSSVQDSI